MRLRTIIGFVASLAMLAPMPGAVLAGARSGLIREATASILRKVGKEAGEEGSEVLASKLDTLAARHGAQAFEAVPRIGPHAVTLIEDAGEHGDVAARLLARHGEQALAVVASRRSLDLVARHGDAAVEVLMKHPGIAVPVIEELGEQGIRVLSALGRHAVRRLAQLQEERWLTQSGRAAQVLAVFERFGDRALDFIWRHKGALAVASVLAAFLADPASFLDGTKRIAHAAVDSASGPVAAGSKPSIIDASSRIHWKVLIASLFVVLLGPSVLRRLRSRRT
jgi:hypothetical protein